MNTIQLILQLIIGLGVLNVWLIRGKRATPYRGGSATDLRGEFQTYGLPPWACPVVGVVKVGAALALIAGIGAPMLVIPAAGVIAFLMAGALVMHFKIRDPAQKSLPAALMFAMSLTVIILQLGCWK